MLQGPDQSFGNDVGEKIKTLSTAKVGICGSCYRLSNRLLFIHVTFVVCANAGLTLPDCKQPRVIDIDTGVAV